MTAAEAEEEEARDRDGYVKLPQQADEYRVSKEAAVWPEE